MLPPCLPSSTRLVVALGVLTSGELALAQTEAPPPTARLEVQSTPGCTTRGDVTARILARAPRIRVVDEGGVLGVRAQFSERPSGEVAIEVVLTRPGALSSTRGLVARSCDEAADAVALIVVVTLDQAPGGEKTAESSTGSNDVTATNPSSNGVETTPRARSTANPVRPSPATKVQSPGVTESDAEREEPDLPSEPV